MAKTKIDLIQELNTLQYELHLLQKIDCSKEDNKKFKELLKSGQSLPDGIYSYKSESGEELDVFYTIHKPTELNSEERMEYILLKQFQQIKTIKNCVVFFTVLTVISLIATFFAMH